MSEQAAARKVRRRKRQPIKTAIEIGLLLGGVSCVLVAYSGGHSNWWYVVGLFIALAGLSLDPDARDC